ncbi:hypothetical protein AcW1_006066 [Taiwanofungus camphoratus]|nr:hypothetical protein AcV5_006388 [Antrodia cinnamomea]KAI0950116.1 hypothetical protein AcV7_008681 [Antrodia cinnamomea]KAI0957788.1 hypothetical protein AcW1_006066 [Antrodia cinnamomea]
MATQIHDGQFQAVPPFCWRLRVRFGRRSQPYSQKNPKDGQLGHPRRLVACRWVRQSTITTRCSNTVYPPIYFSLIVFRAQQTLSLSSSSDQPGIILDLHFSSSFLYCIST